MPLYKGKETLLYNYLELVYGWRLRSVFYISATTRGCVDVVC